MTVDELNNGVEEVKFAMQVVVSKGSKLRSSLKDKSIDLDSRWAAYTTLCNTNVIDHDDPFGSGFTEIFGSNVSMYDDFDIDRGQTTDFVDLYEMILENEEEDSELYKNRDAKMDEWRETVLQSGYSSFTYDW